MIKAVFIDLDNTLIETNAVYDLARADLARFVMSCGPFGAEEVVKQAQRCEIELFEKFGGFSDIMPRAFEETLRHFVPDALPGEISCVRNIARGIATAKVQVKEGVEEALLELSRHFKVYLVTAGNKDTQQRRVEALSFRHLFEKAFVTSEKNRAAYESILRITGCAADEAVMIGDSIRSDIVPAVEAGLAAIYVPAGNWRAWESKSQILPAKGATEHVSLTAAACELIRLHGQSPRQLPPRRDNARDF